MKTFKIVTLGCKVNTYESEVMAESLLKEGFIPAKNNEDVDIVIINTCTVTHVASQKSRQKMHHYKRMYPHALIIATGCYVQDESCKKDLCDIYIGTQGKSNIGKIIKTYVKNESPLVLLDEPRKRDCYEEMTISSYQENTRAFVKIQDGCDNFCSYCIIPFVRGKFHSRPKKDVLNEIHELVQNGFQEIVLTGIDTAGYGKDIHDSFTSLIQEILNQEPNLKRLRISSIEASQIGDEFIELLKKEERIARHLHIPLQSGSQSVLKRMNRKYTKEEFKARIDKVKAALPNLALACDVIVGFPGETEEEFKESVDFIKACGFDFLHVFPYSIRPHTVAASLKPQVDNEVKKQRVHELIEVGKELEKAYLLKFDNQILEVIMESYDLKTSSWKGYSSNYIPIEVSSKDNLHGKMCKVRYHYNNKSELLEVLTN